MRPPDKPFHQDVSSGPDASPDQAERTGPLGDLRMADFGGARTAILTMPYWDPHGSGHAGHNRTGRPDASSIRRRRDGWLCGGTPAATPSPSPSPADVPFSCSEQRQGTYVDTPAWPTPASPPAEPPRYSWTQALDDSGLSVNGSGITVGVLSDSFNDLGGAAADEADGALPPASDIDVLQDLPSGGSDEGRAMMQIVHDIAPGADLAFYTAFGGEQSFADGILALAAAGAKVIVDDVYYSDEPFFQNGVVAQAIQTVEAEGVTHHGRRQ